MKERNKMYFWRLFLSTAVLLSTPTFVFAQAAGQEETSLFGVPSFVNPTNGDFSFRPDSPALALGIEPLDVSKMGRRDMGAK